MLPINPLLQLAPLRVRRAVTRVHDMIWTSGDVPQIEATKTSAQHVSLGDARKRARSKVRPGDCWGRLYDQRWCRVTLPAGKSRWLHWDEEGEATLYVKGVPHYGFDVAHRVCAIPDGIREVWMESLCVQAAIWHPDAKGLSPEGCRFRGAKIQYRDENAWEAYHDINCLYEWMLELRTKEFPDEPPELFDQTVQPALTSVAPLYRRLLRGLDTALDALDTKGLSELRVALRKLYAEMRDAAPLSKAALTGHSHLDLVWLWTEQAGEGKAVHTFANANRLMEGYPEYRFAYSQPASYEAVAKRSPELMRAVKKRLRSGQWEATGGMYVESDSHIACGEGLARSFMIGQDSFQKLTGQRSRILWLPDLFGFSACLPQLMKLSGVDYFFTTKTTWNTVNRFPHSSFEWRGPGGHSVVSHVTQGIQFNNTVSVEQLRAASHQNQQADIHDEFLMPNGWGDGGGGPTEEMCERARRLSGLRGLPELKWDQPEAFFDRLAVKQKQLPALDGEIYLEYHRGTFTTQSEVKARFRELERALQLREAVLVAHRRKADASLDHAWRRMVFAQFHDYIPGSAIPEVYAEGLPELAALAKEQTKSARDSLASKSGDRCLFNPLPVSRRAIAGKKLIELPPLSGVSIRDANVVETSSVVARGHSLTNGRVEARLNAQGGLALLRVDGREVALDQHAGELVLYPDKPASFDPWDFDRSALSLGQPVRGPVKIATEANSILVTRKIGRASSATLRYALQPDDSVLRLTVELDWHEEDVLLKLHFPTGYRGREVRCGTPFGSVLRPQLATTPQVEAMWEWPMSRWATVSNDGEREGLFVVTEAKYGVSCRDGNLDVTLLRSPLHVGFEEHSKCYEAHLSRLPQPSTKYTDQGKHTIELALGFYELTTPREEQPAVLAETLFTAPVSYRGKPIESAFQGIDGGDTLIPHWAQPLGRDSWVLRLHEVSGQRGHAKLRLASGWRAQKTNLLGEVLGKPLRTNRLPFAPYEIVSLRLEKVTD
jgi:alpha-mannosidase